MRKTFMFWAYLVTEISFNFHFLFGSLLASEGEIRIRDGIVDFSTR
jgi:hypothetical protein